MKHIMLALAIIMTPGLAVAGIDYEDMRPGSYDRQVRQYEQTGVDTYTNGPLPGYLKPEYRSYQSPQDRQQADEDRYSNPQTNQYGNPLGTGRGEDRQLRRR